MCMCVYIYIYTYTHTYTREPRGLERARELGSDDAAAAERGEVAWVFITGGCSGRGVQLMGVVLYSKLVYNII